MSFIEQWQASLPASYAGYAKEAYSTEQDIDFTYGLLAAAVLDPASQPVKQFNLEAMQDVQKITEIDKNNNVLRLLQSWSDDKLEAACNLAEEARDSTDLQAALQAVIDHFNALPDFAEALARAVMEQNQASGDVYRVAEQIRAGIVNVGGETNIQSLTININLDDKPTTGNLQAQSELEAISPLPYEPETIEITAGRFLMGSPQLGNAAQDWSQHSVDLPTYSIGKYPVTNAQYAEFVEKCPNRRSKYMSPPWSDPGHPVVGVSWYDAVAYCEWLSEETGRNYRLPSEAEWEKAARGDQDDRPYPWGDELSPDYCNYNGDQTTSVGQYSQGQSPYGCYDMVGNVWEWTSTLWGDDWREAAFKYPYKADDGREDPDEPASVYRVYRGGAFSDDGALLGCSIRNYYAPHIQAMDIGFRVVLDES